MTHKIKRGLRNAPQLDTLRGDVPSLHFLSPGPLREKGAFGHSLLVACGPCVSGSYLPGAGCQVAPAPKSEASTKEANFGVQPPL